MLFVVAKGFSRIVKPSTCHNVQRQKMLLPTMNFPRMRQRGGPCPQTFQTLIWRSVATEPRKLSRPPLQAVRLCGRVGRKSTSKY
mmetsp:Transcript_39628/g.70858  ORF Transcript_39628/g.70858 Transcript_39628/m.70858 type:complete len:85 (+) Transcript_39628:186-440(+)